MARRLIPSALLVLSGSCSNPTGPSSFNEPASLTITGPARVAPGMTAQYSASAKMRDGSTVDFTNKVVWRSGTAALLTISNTGLARGIANGETTVTASYSHPTATIAVMVVPVGTYRLTGIVRDGDLPVAGSCYSYQNRFQLTPVSNAMQRRR